MYEFVKVFGERNSGTNFLNLMLVGNGVRSLVLNKEPDFVPAEWVTRFAEKDREFFVERYLDQLDRQEYLRNFGWKHARVSVDRLAALEFFPRTFFILLIRNPVNFVASLHRRPYNVLPGILADRKQFIRSPLIANERDHLDSILVRNPVEFWVKKTTAAIEMAASVKNACLLRYEDLVADTVGAIRWLGRAGLDFATDDIVQVSSTKKDPVSFAEYRTKALSFDPDREFDAEDLAFIMGQVPRPLARLVGYEDGRTSWPEAPWTSEMFSHLVT